MDEPPLGPSKVQWVLLMTRFGFVATVMDVFFRNLLSKLAFFLCVLSCVPVSLVIGERMLRSPMMIGVPDCSSS